MKYSIIVPVYNRPDEVDELLESLCEQKVKDFDVIIVEDGSATPCKDVCEKYAGILQLHYYFKENSGPGQSRNYGAERAQGQWLIVLDSDVVLPEGYLQAVDEKTYPQPLPKGRGVVTSADEPSAGKSIDSPPSQGGAGGWVCWGGPDAAHESFTPVQKAISYAMTSFFTTGGIRGGKKQGALDKFYPRSYNMGIRREVYLELGGFSKMRFGEDIDFSYRIVEAGYKTALLSEAWVWHKRRTDLRKFFRQVYNSGIARINLTKRHPGTLKLVHLLPTVFTIGVIGLVLLSAVGRLLMYYVDNDEWRWLCLTPWLPILLYSGVILVDSTVKNKSLKVGLLSVPAAFVQLMGYGLGFIESWWKRCVMGKDEFQAFEKNFYK